ncbi:MAG: polyhydroxyalkanoic acid system family protein [Planctomycetales bacterium]
MPSLNLSIPHQQAAEEATEKLQRFTEMMRSQYGSQIKDLQETWDQNNLTFSFSAKGFKINGIM